MKISSPYISIDYGSKLAGTTAVCYTVNGVLHFAQSEKKKDADLFIGKLLKQLSPKYVYIDAPLSLPAAYFGRGDNYFYRECDKAAQAMSPMFLGGLTARAMKLAAQYEEIKFRETYPAYLIKMVLELGEYYTKREAYNNQLAEILVRDHKLDLAKNPTNWHQLDALACCLSGTRVENQNALLIGEEGEGLIWV